MFRSLVCLVALVSCIAAATAVDAQDTSDPSAQDGLQIEDAVERPSRTLSVEEAVQRALAYNYAVRNSRLDVAVAEEQIQEAWGQLFPQLDASAGYTRNVVTANPFAGSDAGNLFSSLGSSGWVEYNEQIRQQNIAAGRPPNQGTLTVAQFQERVREGQLDAAGGELPPAGSNPFSVDNNFTTGLSLRQTLYNGAAFSAIRGAQELLDLNQLALDRQQQLTVQEVRNAFYQALLAQQQVNVTGQSVARTQETLDEVTQQVRAGVVPKFQRLSAEVQLANLETELLQVQSQAEASKDQLKFLLGLPVETDITLSGELEGETGSDFLTVSAGNAYGVALEQRPDIARARTAIELRGIDVNMTQAQYLPTVSAVANFNYTGNVPDQRTSILQDRSTGSPFDFVEQQRGFFSDSYWNPSLSVGLQLSWNIFNGFQTSARVQQRQIELERARLQLEQLRESVRLEVEQSLRSLRTAWQRIQAQGQNVENAELNFEYALQRLRVGSSDQLAVREASQQLDQSRLNYLQAIYDFVVARNAFRTAMGVPMTPSTDLRFTQLIEE